MAESAIIDAMGRERSRERLIRYAVYLGLASLAVYGYFHLNLPLGRLPDGLREMGRMVAFRMFPPDLAYAPSLVEPFLETFAMAFVGTIFGIALSVPLAWMASSNMTPSRRIAYPLARGFVIVTRSVHEVIWALILVALFGFGPLAGMIVLTLHFIGFGGKLLAENVEAADMRPVEAIRAAGGSRLKQMVLGVYPQVRPVWVGIFIYGWDIVLRASFILGMVGAGGVGAQLRGSIEGLRYHRVGTILIIIFIIVAVGEVLSMRLRKRIT
ncbi:MAG: phosphonate ABC transporter, permease protein PhnE [Hyphomicrobiaceae bacterium]|nr:phosphonate ABC transporter, permease protein PhnE [Hyphomicrobiaceae bacterium]